MADIHIHLTMPPDVHVQIDVPQLEDLRQEMRHGFIQLNAVIAQLGADVSEAADNLTAAVQSVQTGFDQLNATLQTEMQEIANALSSAPTDQALREASIDAVTRLSTLSASIAEMNTTIQGIIP